MPSQFLNLKNGNLGVGLNKEHQPGIFRKTDTAGEWNTYQKLKIFAKEHDHSIDYAKN